MGYAILDQRGGDSLTATTLDGYSLLADTTVSSATTTVNFTGLNIGWGDELLLVSDINNTSTGNANAYFAYVNGNTTNTNYYRQYADINGSSISAGRANDSCILYAENGSKMFGVSRLKLTNSGFFVYQSNITRQYGGSSVFLSPIYGTSTFTASSITSISITASSSIGVGSRFQLYKSGGGASRTWAIT